MSLDLYNERILALAGNIPRIGKLENAQSTSVAVSHLCGSKISVQLNLDEAGLVADYAHELQACALGQASASIVAQNIIDSAPQELHELARTMRAMLQEDGAPPSGKWQDLEVLSPVRDYKNRHTSTLLVFSAIEDCLSQLGV